MKAPPDRWRRVALPADAELTMAQVHEFRLRRHPECC